MPCFLTVIACASALVQGGYFPAFFLIAGAALAAALAVCRRPVRCSGAVGMLLALSAWYLLSSAVRGLSARSLAQACLPLVCCLYALLHDTMREEERRSWARWLCRTGGVMAAAAILTFFGVIPLSGAVTAHRLQFTFQYVNAAGAWFAAVLLLTLEERDKWALRLSPFTAAALLLTRSVGAIGAFLLALLLTLPARFGWRDRRTWLLGGGAALAGLAAVLTRWEQAAATFQERLVQSLDGLRGIAASLVFGWGAGNWGSVASGFRSYDYRAQVVHNSYVQAGVEAGLPALLLLAGAVVLAVLALRKTSGSRRAMAALIPFHALFDLTFCFFSVDALALALLAPPEGRGKVLPRPAVMALGGACFVFFILLAVLSRVG